MHGGRRHQKNGIDIGTLEQRRVIGECVRNAERFRSPCQLVGQRTACRHKRRAGDAVSEVFRMMTSHPAESGDANAQRLFQPHNSTMRFSRHERVAASASASAFTPSSIDVRTGRFRVIASMKCA